MKTFATVGYVYDELDDVAQEKVREDVARFLWEILPDDVVTADIEAFLRHEFGIPEDTVFPLSVSWNASCSQSDYVGLDGDLTPAQAPGLVVPPDTARVFFTTRNGWGVTTDVYITTDDGDDEEPKETIEAVRSACRSAMQVAYDGIDGLTNHDAVMQWITESEDYYTDDGTLLPNYLKEVE